MKTTKVVILAGGQGLRLFEETITTPKPLTLINKSPIIWHIMSRFSHFHFTQFVICLGHKSKAIKSYFFNLPHTVISETEKSVTIKLNDNNWVIDLVYTGEDTMTGGRIKQISPFINDHFFVTYSDNISDINAAELFNYHISGKKLCTLTTINLKLNYGTVIIDQDSNVKQFKEKPVLEDTLINAGFFVCNKEVISLINDDTEVFEIETLQKIIKKNSLFAYKHNGFWKSIDTYKDLVEARQLNLDKLIING